MCLMVWIGTEVPIQPLPAHAEPDPITEYFCIEPVAGDAAIRDRFSSTYTTYVGSHQGCGCGFNSGLMEFEGFETEAELGPLIGALLDDEQREYLSERRSRERLHSLVVSALASGPVAVYSCWAGGEGEPATSEETVEAKWLLEKTAPLKEGVLYRVHSA